MPRHRHYPDGSRAAETSPRRSFYNVLGVPQNAPSATIKKAHHAKVLATHPDRAGSSNEASTEDFRTIRLAYEVLRDERKRALYDAHFEWPIPGYNEDGERQDGLEDVAPYEPEAQYMPPPPPPPPAGPTQTFFEPGIFINGQPLFDHLAAGAGNYTHREYKTPNGSTHYYEGTTENGAHFTFSQTTESGPGVFPPSLDFSAGLESLLDDVFEGFDGFFAHPWGSVPQIPSLPPRRESRRSRRNASYYDEDDYDSYGDVDLPAYEDRPRYTEPRKSHDTDRAARDKAQETVWRASEKEREREAKERVRENERRVKEMAKEERRQRKEREKEMQRRSEEERREREMKERVREADRARRHIERAAKERAKAEEKAAKEEAKRQRALEKEMKRHEEEVRRIQGKDSSRRGYATGPVPTYAPTPPPPFIAPSEYHSHFSRPPLASPPLIPISPATPPIFQDLWRIMDSPAHTMFNHTPVIVPQLEHPRRTNSHFW